MSQLICKTCGQSFDVNSGPHRCPGLFPDIDALKAEVARLTAERDEALADAREYKRLANEAADVAVAQRRDFAAERDALRDVLKGIRIYANDTLSGRTDGPDDRTWQREAVIELRNRARAVLDKFTPPDETAV